MPTLFFIDNTEKDIALVPMRQRPAQMDLIGHRYLIGLRLLGAQTGFGIVCLYMYICVWKMKTWDKSSFEWEWMCAKYFSFFQSPFLISQYISYRDVCKEDGWEEQSWRKEREAKVTVCETVRASEWVSICNRKQPIQAHNFGFSPWPEWNLMPASITHPIGIGKNDNTMEARSFERVFSPPFK